MAKRNKQMQSCNLSEFARRPVNQKDRWCKKVLQNGHIPEGYAPWGYVITVPFLPNCNTFLQDVNGYIVRTKKHCGCLLLQVVMKPASPQQYGVKSFSRLEPASKTKRKNKNKKKRYRVIHIRNLGKTDGKW